MLKLCYREFELGTLLFDNNTKEYVYCSDIENEEQAKAKYLGMEFYYLSNSNNRRQKDIFTNFLEFLPALKRPDIVKEAKIDEKDNTYEKLVKLAKIQVFDEGFYLKNC